MPEAFPQGGGNVEIRISDLWEDGLTSAGRAIGLPNHLNPTNPHAKPMNTRSILTAFTFSTE
jgi:hypothetical protein